MAYKSERAGKATRAMAKKQRQSAVWIAVMGVAFVIVVWILLQNSKALEIGGIGILLILVLLRVIPGIIDKQMGKKLKDENKAIRGAEVQEQVGDMLEELPEDSHVLHDKDASRTK